MEVVVTENIANKPMQNAPYVLGEISAPDSHYNPVLYSHYQAGKQFNTLNKDIYQKQKRQKSLAEEKTPTSVWCVLGIAVAFALYKSITHLIKLKK